jgi:phospholipid transport system substrate-binding protein
MTTATLLITLFLSASASKDEVTKPLKTVVNSVRYGKDLLALKNFAGEDQGKILCAESWDKATDAQKKEFIDLWYQLFGKIAFPKIRKNFENLDTILYDDPVFDGDTKATVASTILINHPLKKQELKVKYKMVKNKTGWQVVDVAVLGDSMLQGIKDDQVQPLLKEGGWDKLLQAMRDKAAELKGVELK